MTKVVLENTNYLCLILVLPVLVYYSIISYRRSNYCLYQFARIKKNIFTYIAFTTCLSISLVGLVVALSNPKFQYLRTVFSRSGISIVIGIDVSKSMLAEDEMLSGEDKKVFPVPNRLNRARAFALNILNSLRGERVGVFMFAHRGVEIIPLTGDYGYCRYLLKHINDTSITLPGSDLKEAILTGLSMLEDASSHQVRVMVIISDGEDISD
ncbi:MAG: VWA domain-containing protein, partial [Desulfobacterota bacterium]|nr:VWA domain-containing protein [Thermodesulfobacteriota bacterium]